MGNVTEKVCQWRMDCSGENWMVYLKTPEADKLPPVVQVILGKGKEEVLAAIVYNPLSDSPRLDLVSNPLPVPMVAGILETFGYERTKRQQSGPGYPGYPIPGATSFRTSHGG